MAEIRFKTTRLADPINKIESLHIRACGYLYCLEDWQNDRLNWISDCWNIKRPQTSFKSKEIYKIHHCVTEYFL